MSRYRKVDPKMWADAKFRALSPPPPCGQSLFQYLLTGPETTSLPGILVGGQAHFAEALGWPTEGFAEAFQEVFRQGLAKADWEARMVWLPNAKKYNVPESPNVVKSWRDHWDNVPECELKLEAYYVLKAFAEGLGKAFALAFAQACAQPSPKALANPEPDQEQDQEQDPDLAGDDSEPGSGARPEKPSKSDLDPQTLTLDELRAHAAIVGDVSLLPIVPFPAQTARDLVASGPGVDVPYQIRKAGAWLRANPTKAKKLGARFLLGWIGREQERGGGARTGGPSEPDPSAASARRVAQTQLDLTARAKDALSPAEQSAQAEALASLTSPIGELP